MQQLYSNAYISALAAGATRASLLTEGLPRSLYLVRVGNTTQRLVLK